MWWNIAASSGNIRNAAHNRGIVAEIMTLAEIAEA
jgi:hypothetical protein